MPTKPRDETAETDAIESITDLTTLRDRDDVPFHEDRDVVDPETVDLVDGLDDMVVVGVTNDDGDVLLRKLTEDCDWKLPLETVAAGGDYTEAGRQAVEEVVGLDVNLDALEGVWSHEVRSETESRAASRRFVVFSASLADEEASLDDLESEDADDSHPVGVGWFDELPADAANAPGTGLFFD